MKAMNRVMAVCATVALLWCARARAQQVLEQVPSDSVGFFEVKNLQSVSTKVAKLAKTLGVDQFVPQFADPLGALMDQYGLKQGVNKDGDVAIAFLKPANEGANNGGEQKPPPAVVVVPVSDYKAFLGNFNNVKDAGNGISEVQVPKNSETLYVVNHGNFAVAAMEKALLSKPAGLKLSGSIGKEAQAKDAILYFDVKALRPEAQKGLKQAREEFDKAAKNPQGQNNNPFAQQMTPQMKAILDQYLKAADQIVNDTNSAAISFNLSDTGIGAAALADFDNNSTLGKLMTKVQNTDQPLLAGLPDTAYFGFGGAKITPAVMDQLMSDFLTPLMKQLNPANDQELNKALDAMKEAVSAMKDASFGYVYPGGAPGESLVQAVTVTHGDAKKILSAEKQALPAMSALAGAGGKVKMDINVQSEPKTIDGVELTPFTIKFTGDQNDPMAVQQEKVMSMIYGKNGMSGVMGAVDENTFLMVQGGSDKLISDAIAAAKANKDPLSGLANVKAVAAEMPKERAAEFYFALDNVVNAGVRFAKQNGLPVNIKIPPNLPPIGFSAGTEQTTLRMDLLVPTQLIQSLTAAGMQAYMQMNQGPGAGGQGGGV